MTPIEIQSIKKVSYGHWEIILKQDYYKRKYPFTLSSSIYWKYTTTDSMMIDDYYSDEERRSNRGKKQIIKLVKMYGVRYTKNK